MVSRDSGAGAITIHGKTAKQAGFSVLLIYFVKLGTQKN